MNIRNFHVKTDEHHSTWLQIPWYINASLCDTDRARMESHLDKCAACRAELAQQRLVHRAVSGESGVHHISSGSLNRLRQRLEAEPQSPRQLSSALLAASVATFAVALGLVIFVSHRDRRTAPYRDDYSTVSTPARRVPHEIIRAVFAPTITLAQLQGLLDESHLKIVAGPTEAGVYSLAATQGQSVNELLSNLRQNRSVRFAEATGP